MHPTVDRALMLALREMRRELRWMLEVYGEASANNPPDLTRVTGSERAMIDDVLNAIRACAHCTGGDMPADDQPAWLDHVIRHGMNGPLS